MVEVEEVVVLLEEDVGVGVVAVLGTKMLIEVSLTSMGNELEISGLRGLRYTTDHIPGLCGKFSAMGA